MQNKYAKYIFSRPLLKTQRCEPVGKGYCLQNTHPANSSVWEWNMTTFPRVPDNWFVLLWGKSLREYLDQTCEWHREYSKELYRFMRLLPSYYTTFVPTWVIAMTTVASTCYCFARFGHKRARPTNTISFIHSFIFHYVNPYKVPNNLKDVELVILLIMYT
jgi:hypothetical protein